MTVISAGSRDNGERTASVLRRDARLAGKRVDEFK